MGKENRIAVALDDPRLQYTGRIDRSDPKHPEFVFPATSLRFRFRGERAYLAVTNRRQYWASFLGIIMDGRQYCVRLQESGITEAVLDAGQGCVRLPEGGSAEPDVGQYCVHLPEGADVGPDVGREAAGGVHEVLIFKRMDACHELRLEGLELDADAELLTPPERPRGRIEVYGDSVSAGEVSEAVSCAGCPDPEHDGEYSNSWYSYAWMTARLLGAELHDIAQGGAALMDGAGWFCAPEYIGMESIWDKVHYNPALHEETQWDFRQYTPHLVLVAIGQNDSNPVNFMAEDAQSERSRVWKQRYRAFLLGLRETYPDAHMICMTTLLEHDEAWDDAIAEVCGNLQDAGIHSFRFRRNGCGTPGHLRIPEAREMAQELAAYVETLGIPGLVKALGIRDKE